MKTRSLVAYAIYGALAATYISLTLASNAPSAHGSGLGSETLSLLASAFVVGGLLFLFSLQHSLVVEPASTSVGGRLLSRARARSRSLLMSNVVMMLISAMVTAYIVVLMPEQDLTRPVQRDTQGQNGEATRAMNPEPLTEYPEIAATLLEV